MMTIRSHDQFNTTIYGDDDRYRGIHDERRVVLLQPDDLATAVCRPPTSSISSTGTAGGAPGRAVPRRALRPAPWELRHVLPRGQRAGPDRRVARDSNTPTSKAVVVTVEPRTAHAGS
jgi:hypothetical protein